MLAQQRLELSAVLAARAALGAVHTPAVPGQPVAGVGVDVLAVAQVEQLALKRDPGVRLGPRAADLALNTTAIGIASP